MGRLTFTHLALLGGLAALVIPVLIHLLFRRPRRPMRFSTVQFFLEKQEQTARRQKIRHWLLLLTRCLLLVLVVLAFARPYWRQSGQAATRPRQDVVLVLDRSASMQVRDRWPNARTQAMRILRQLGFEDRAALVEASAPARILSPLAPVSKAQAALRDLQAGFGGGDLAQGLAEAVRLLGQAEPHRQASIVLISDFQRNGASSTNAMQVPRRIDLKLTPVGETGRPNLALTGLNLEPGGAIRIDAAGFGDGAPDRVGAQVLADGVPLTNCVLNVTSATFQVTPLPILGPGWHTIEARLGAEREAAPDELDSFPADNRRWLTLEVPAPVRILLAEPRPSSRSFEEESFFIASALASAATNGVPLQYERASSDRLLSALALPRDLVILPRWRGPTEALGAGLRGFVTNGGGLLIFLGEGVAPGHYQSVFGDLLTLRRVEGDPDRPEEFWHLGEIDKTSPVFAAFRGQNSGDLTRPAFKRRFALEASVDSHIEARFTDGVPFIVTKKLGRGRIVVINTSANTAWTDWPKRKTYVPWLEGVIALACGRSALEAATAAPDLVCGREAAIPINSTRPVQVRGPQCQQQFQPHAGTITLCPERPGIFSILGADGRELGRVSASVPNAESDLAAITTEEFSSRLVRTRDPGANGLALSFLNEGSRELWRLLLLAALGLLVAEFLLANRTLA